MSLTPSFSRCSVSYTTHKYLLNRQGIVSKYLGLIPKTQFRQPCSTAFSKALTFGTALNIHKHKICCVFVFRHCSPNNPFHLSSSSKASIFPGRYTSLCPFSSQPSSAPSPQEQTMPSLGGKDGRIKDSINTIQVAETVLIYTR